MTTGCRIHSTEHAEALHRAQTALARLNLVSITILEELMCYVSTNGTTRNSRIQLTAPTDAGSASTHRCQVMSGGSTTLMNSENDPRRDTRATSAVLDGSLGLAIRRNWGLRFDSRGNGSIVSELGTGGKLSIVCSYPLVLLFSPLLHPSSLLWISAWYKLRRHGFYHLPISVNGRWSFPVSRIWRKFTQSCTARLWDLWVHKIAYVWWLNYSFFPFSSHLFSIPLYSLDFGPVKMASAQVFTNSGWQPSEGGVFPCAGSTERLPDCANRQWDFWDCMSTYAAWL